jgi:CelD/BcsL family acetyltransferase involved in cellulose biosynthesis
MTADTLTVRCQPLLCAGELQDDWQSLQARAQVTVFLSWQWIGQWLEAYTPDAQVLRVMQGQRLVGLGVLVASDERRHRIITSRSLRLHQTGQEEQDQIWIEYNGFLAEKGCEDKVALACLRHLGEQPGWDEFVIGAMDVQQARRFAQVSGLNERILWEAPCFGVDLSAIRESGTGYLDSLSKNTRYQINRSHRLYKQLGAVTLQWPNSVAEAQAMFADIGPLHLQRWGDGPGQSGFANGEFLRFHCSMIQNYWESGGVDLVVVKAGDQVITTFYNLLFDGVVYFYLGGVRTESDNRFKPGLLGHSLCIEEYARKGFRFYDFMGGDERYKMNLGRNHHQLVQVALQRRRLKFELENIARWARKYIPL